ncbi:glucokinase [Desulfocastanea catecholica]
MATILAADIGGTKSEVAIFPLDGADGGALVQKRYVNAFFSGIDRILEDFLAGLEQLPQLACLAVAGLVSGDTARMTNLPWEIGCRRLEQRFGFSRVVLINDLTAVGSSLAMLQPDDLLEIQAAPGAGEVRGIIAPGTGLGEGLLVEYGGQEYVRGSEGGHTDFAPVDEEQLALLVWMRKKRQPVSYEMLIAGPGLANLYDFCREYHQIEESAWIVEAMHTAQDRIPVIVGGAIGTIGGMGVKSCPLCRRVIDLFLSILGSEAGNLALKLYAKGGIYLGGGILPRLIDHVQFDGFLQSFHAKGQMSGFMQEIPINVILRRDAALLGAARYGRLELHRKSADGW